MGDKIEELISALKYGSFDEKIESLTLMRRKITAQQNLSICRRKNIIKEEQ